MPNHYRLKHILALDGSVILCYCVRNWQIKCESGLELGNMIRRSLTYSEAENPGVSKRRGAGGQRSEPLILPADQTGASLEGRTFVFL